jgi:phosphoglycolate phosphatase-like HAD superfamily hydrolase
MDIVMKIIFDLDNTLADMNHRIHYLTPGPDGRKRWREFHEACDLDIPITPIVETARLYYRAGHRVEIWTGRNEVVREKTLAWLKLHEVPHHLLKMRPRHGGSTSKVANFKQHWLLELAPHLRPDLVFEDQQSTVDMWRANGIRCCQVAPGDF